jgi:hypothetical protein
MIETWTWAEIRDAYTQALRERDEARGELDQSEKHVSILRTQCEMFSECLADACRERNEARGVARGLAKRALEGNHAILPLDQPDWLWEEERR